MDGDVPGLLHHAGDAAGLRGAAAAAGGQRALRGAPAPGGPGRSRWGHPRAHGRPRRRGGHPGRERECGGSPARPARAALDGADARTRVSVGGAPGGVQGGTDGHDHGPAVAAGLGGPGGPGPAHLRPPG